MDPLPTVSTDTVVNVVNPPTDDQPLARVVESNEVSGKRKAEAPKIASKKPKTTHHQLALSMSTLRPSVTMVPVRPSVDNLEHVLELITAFYRNSLPKRVSYERFVTAHRRAFVHNLDNFLMKQTAKVYGRANPDAARLLSVPMCTASLVSAFGNKEIHAGSQPVMLYADHPRTMRRVRRVLGVEDSDAPTDYVDFLSLWDDIVQVLTRDHLIGFGQVLENSSLLHTGVLVKEEGSTHVCSPIALSASDELLAGVIKFREFVEENQSYLPKCFASESGLIGLLSTTMITSVNIDDKRFIRELLVKVRA